MGKDPRNSVDSVGRIMSDRALDPLGWASTRVETERLLLRAPGDADLAHMPGIFHDPEVYAYTSNIPYPYGPAEASACLERYRRLSASGEALTLFACLRDPDRPIGLVVLKLSNDRSSAELGYALGRAWWGRGYASEAGAAMLRLAFEMLRVDRVTAHAMTANPASSRVLEKIGMRSLGVVSEACEKDGVRHDAEGFALTRDAWARARDPRASQAGTHQR